MDRKDLIRATHVLPDIHEVWENRIQDLETERDRIWNDLKNATITTHKPDQPHVEKVTHDLERLDRSITFLDRALLHLDDLEKGTQKAADLPLRPD